MRYGPLVDGEIRVLQCQLMDHFRLTTYSFDAPSNCQECVRLAYLGEDCRKSFYNRNAIIIRQRMKSWHLTYSYSMYAPFLCILLQAVSSTHRDVQAAHDHYAGRSGYLWR